MTVPQITRWAVAWDELAPTFASFVTRHWQPVYRDREREYRDDLAAFLRGRIPSGCRVEIEYRDRGTTADIGVLWEGFLEKTLLMIEMKRELRTKGECDRLVGQIESLKGGPLLVILVGSSDDQFVGRLRERYPQDESTSLRIVEVQADR